jgi:hypothetical protein
MILEQTGKICDDLYSIGYHFIPAFLLMSTPPVLFDAGLTIAGPRYLENLREYLGNTDRLGYIFLTHSQTKHTGSQDRCKRTRRVNLSKGNGGSAYEEPEQRL